MIEALWPYLVVLFAGALPNGVFRAAGVFLGRGLSEGSELFRWVRVVAVALLAAVVSKIVVTPPAALAAFPLWLSMLAVATGVASFFAIRSLVLSILAGEAVFVAIGWWLKG